MVREEKIKKIEELKKLMEEFPVIGVVDLYKFPSRKLQEIRKIVRENGGVIRAAKKSVIVFAIKEVDKENIQDLEKIIPNQPAIVLMKESAFKSYLKLSSLKFETFAKEFDIASNDIVIPAGVTGLLAGPVISELTRAGIPAGVEEGKISIKREVVVVRSGEKISKDVANALRKLGIKPIYISFNVVGFYENGRIYPKEILELVRTFPEKLVVGYQHAVNLSVNVSYPTKETIKFLLIKAFNSVKAIERMGGVS